MEEAWKVEAALAAKEEMKISTEQEEWKATRRYTETDMDMVTTGAEREEEASK